MDFRHPIPKLKGIATLTFRDAETLEVKREYEQENAISMGAILWGLMSLETGTYLAIAKGDYSNAVNGAYIAISERKSAPGITTNLSAAQPVVDTTYAVDNIIQQQWTFFSGSPDYAETVRRFNPPGSPRVINTIYVNSALNNYRRPFSTAALATSCTQATNEVLDITYRIQFFYSTPDPTAHPVALDYGLALAHKIHAGSQQAFPRNQALYWTGPPVDGQQFYGTCGTFAGSEGDSGGTNTLIPRYFKTRFNLNKTISNDIGRIMRSVGYGYNSSLSTNMLSGAEGGIRTPLWAPLTPAAGFTNKPIQTIHNHSALAIEPWLDVDFLTTGQGTLTVDGSGWTNPGDWPEFWRIDHTLGGQVGVSRYMLRKRVTIGFDGNSYQSNRTAIVHTMWQNDATPANVTVVGGHGLRQLYNWNEYDHETVVKWDDSGITVMHLNEPEPASFDSTTTPALPVTAIRQCSTDTNGNIWVADGSSGLYKITDPFGTPTVTKMTEASNSLPVGSENNCYGVAVGFGGDVLAVVEGGLIRTTTPNGATPTFAAESFTYTGISDANWNRVDYLLVDPESPTFDSILVRATSGVLSGAQQQIWWSTAQAAGIAGVTSSSISVSDPKGGSRFGRIKCSKRGSMWSYHGPASTNSGAMRFLYFGTTSQISPTGLGINGWSTPNFMYDYYDTPYMYNCESNNDFGPGVWSPQGGGVSGATGKVFSRGERGAIASNFTSYSGSYFAFEDPISNGLWINNNRGNDATGENTNYCPLIFQFNPIDTAQITGATAALNNRYSPNEEIFWDKYHWNGAAWVKNFFEPATDTGTITGGPFAGDRHNFDTEDHTFTGRSMIDATAAMAASNFAASANATFAFKLIPDAKLSNASDAISSAQEKPRVLLDLSDETQQFQIVWDDGIQGNISIVEDGDGGTVIAATPTNGSTYRLVVTVAGTAVNVYLDGSLIGSTVTLANAFDWDNGDGKLKAFIGCSAYFWTNPQRNSTWEHNFYRGVMENVQFWNVAWTAGNVTTDFGDIDGVIGLPAANLVARYQLTQSLVGTETKLTHVGAEALVDGVTIAFTNGAAPTAFIGGDYHTFGVVDGIFKDNAIAFTQEYNVFFKPTDFNFSDFDNGSSYPATGGNTIVASTTAIVDEPAMWVNDNIAIFGPIAATSISDGVMNSVYTTPGEAAQGHRDVNPGHNFGYGTMTAQPITGDGWFQAGAQHDNTDVIIGLSDTNLGTNHIWTNIDFGIRFRYDGTVDIVELGATVAAAAATYEIGDIFRVRRIGTAITYYKVVSGVPTLIHTSATTSSGTVYGRVSFYEEGNGILDAAITYTRPARVLSIGNPGAFTGIFDPKFYIVDGEQPQSLNINIAGSPATVVVSNTHYDGMAVPAPGEVVVNDRMGWLVFNSADDGSAITGNVTVIYNET